MFFKKVGELVRNDSAQGSYIKRDRNSLRISIFELSYLSRCSFLYDDLVAKRSSKYVMLAACLLALSHRHDVIFQLGQESRSHVT